MQAGILQNDLFYCDHLGASENDERDIASFTVRHRSGSGLVNYIQYQAFPDEDQGNMRTYLVRDNRTSELAGYFSLKAGLISLNETVKDAGVTFDTLPGVELADFAVNDTYMKKHKALHGIGRVIFNDFVVPIIEDSSERIGIRLIYIFALPEDDLIKRYHDQYGFVRLDKKEEAELHKRLKPEYDGSCIFMYQPLR